MTFLDALTNEIATYEAVDGPVIVTGFVVLAEFINDAGQRSLYCDTLEDQRCYQTLGLLAYGTAVESARAANDVLGDDP